jgi:hypothetical protein
MWTQTPRTPFLLGIGFHVPGPVVASGQLDDLGQALVPPGFVVGFARRAQLDPNKEPQLDTRLPRMAYPQRAGPAYRGQFTTSVGTPPMGA